jgi:hypothetical protein
VLAHFGQVRAGECGRRLGRHAVQRQPFARQIEPAAPGILAQIAQDVGELQGAAEMVRHLVGGLGGVAERADGEPPDGAGHAVAIEV